MRWLLPILVLTACTPEAEPEVEKSLYKGAGRDRLCIDGERAGFIAYGQGDANCSARGRIERAGGRLSFIPTGDQDCRIGLEQSDGTIRLGRLNSVCAFYCGPGADFSGREFRKADGDPKDAGDFAGDPLC